MRPELPERVRELLGEIVGSHPDYTPAIEKLVVDDQILSIVLKAVDSLPDREKVAICLHYGPTGEPKRLDEVGFVLRRKKDQNIPLSRERTRQIVKRGLGMLRHPNRIHRIVGVLDAISGRTPHPY